MIKDPYHDVYKAIAGITEVTFPNHARSVRGNAAQLLFRAEAAARGLVPCSPAWNLSVDHVLIDYFDQHLVVRVEIKQSQQENKGAYTVELRSSQGIGGSSGSKKGVQRIHDYAKSVDVFAILLPKAASWYLIPTSRLKGKSSIRLKPGLATCGYAEFENAWHILEQEEHVLVREPSVRPLERIREKYKKMRAGRPRLLRPIRLG